MSPRLVRTRFRERPLHLRGGAGLLGRVALELQRGSGPDCLDEADRSQTQTNDQRRHQQKHE